MNLPGQRAAAVVVGQMATEILALEQRIAAVDDLIAEQLDQHPLAPIIESLPGMGPLLTAELLVHTAGMTEYDSPTKLAAHAGLAPVSHDSGTVSGNHRPARRYHRRLRHILWMAAFTAAILALARRRVDVLWALIRDRKTFTRPAPATRAAA
ncbi:transposase [Plantactinospora sp. GCM10030261]|uniref:transposase n=1 Tax=Plantactinospora sp. GCM10030261 TaxID=3273420 RepID=UPI003608308C